jgi:aminopeptidase
VRINDINAYYKQQIKNVEKLAAASALWGTEARAALQRAAQDFPDTDALLQSLFELNRLNKIFAAGLGDDEAFRAAVKKDHIPEWADYSAPPVSDELQESLAKKIYNIEAGKDTNAILTVGDGARQIAKSLFEKCVADGVAPYVDFRDDDFHNFALNHTTEDGVKALAADYIESTASVTKRMVARPGNSGPPLCAVRPDREQLYKRETKPYIDRVRSGDIFYTLTVIPTKHDAALDGIPYDYYVKLFFELCDQPWEQIGRAQTKLIQEFNAASEVHITNDDGTDIRMSLIDNDGTHFTFCNSLIAKNVPGSEIFSAPRLDSVNGAVVAKGRFTDDGLKIMENLTLTFKNGLLTDWKAEKGQEYLDEIIGIDEGTRHVGELGIGTNPHLRRHVLNGLLVEKIGGSFHLAVGAPYSYTSYGGEPVKVNNGGNSALHWDLTTMLRGKGGKIYLDDRLVMDNGEWLDKSKYDVLNRGWEAVPKAERPDYWKNYYDPKLSQP